MRSPFNYIEEANLTASNAFHGDKVSRTEFVNVLRSCIESLQRLDAIKKAVFYGRELAYIPTFPAISEFGRDVLEVPVLVAEEEDSVLILHSIIGGATEASERLELLLNFFLNPCTGFDTVNFAEEIGDGHWYDAIGAKAIGVTFDEIQRRNIAKLRHRFPNKFTEHDANNRDLFGERAILAAEPEHDLDTPAGMSAANEGVDFGEITGGGTGQALPPVLCAKQTAHLENWFKAGNILWGNVSKHPNQEYFESNGNFDAFVHTSLIVSLDEENGICETRNTTYTLGKKAVAGTMPNA